MTIKARQDIIVMLNKKGSTMNIPDEVMREAQISGVLGQITNLELFDELRRRGVSPDTYQAYDYAKDQMADARTDNHEEVVANLKELGWNNVAKLVDSANE